MEGEPLWMGLCTHNTDPEGFLAPFLPCKDVMRTHSYI